MWTLIEVVFYRLIDLLEGRVRGDETVRVAGPRLVLPTAFLLLGDEPILHELSDRAFHAGSTEVSLPLDGCVIRPGDAGLVVRV